MLLSLRWLQDFIDLPTTDVAELSYALDMLGLTVDAVEHLTADWDEVYVGTVQQITPHPDADRIRVCQVDSGEGTTQIICGAWNFEEGATVAVARPGAVLAGGLVIGERTIRGVNSSGMICSERELGLGEDHAGILVLDDGLALGRRFAELVELPDVVFELDIAPNRPDALSLVGVARDLAAYFDIEYQVPEVELSPVAGRTAVTVDIEDPSGCRRFTAREIRGVEIGQAPLSVRHRLHKVGIRSISNVVDVTNYVMIELGHPLHAFDADKISGDHLVVKRATADETLKTLDGTMRQLHPDDLVIYDDEGPTSMSGTMGGARSEVSDSTVRVLMEAASWDPPTIMHMWRRHDLRSEAATRFERGVDPNLADIANQRASAMVARLAGGEVLEGAVDEVAVHIEPTVVDLSIDEVERVLGPGFTVAGVTAILTKIGMDVEGSDPMRVAIPTFRPDASLPADLIEEIARIHGYDKFEPRIPTGPAGGLSVEQQRARRLMTSLTGAGLHQAINLTFTSPESLAPFGLDASGLLTVKNPLREQESKLRPSLLPGLLGTIRYNQSHGRHSVAIFEVGTVFSSEKGDLDPRLPKETQRVAWAVVGDVGLAGLDGGSAEADGPYSLALWRHVADALGLDATVEPDAPEGFHPGRTAWILIDDVPVGHVGELAPASAAAFDVEGRVAVAELDLDPLIHEVDPVQVAGPSLFPHVDFDLSFLVSSSTPAGSIVDITKAAGADLVEATRVFDEFRGEGVGEGMKAIAIRYRLRAPDRTLDASEIGPIRQGMIDAAAEAGAELRGV